MNKENINPISAFNKLRTYQQKAFDMMVSYFEAYRNLPRKKTGLVAMPTGSGKTPIMAVLSRCYNNINNVLIVSPRTAVTTQLYNEISKAIFEVKFELTIEIPKTVIKIKTNYEKILTEYDQTVLITTIQKIDYLGKKKTDIYNHLINNTDLVIFDEGHYEPASSWSKTIRAFNCPRIIFSATPFRNDFRTFDIDWNYAYSISYSKLKSWKFLRNVKFEEKSALPVREEFIDDVILEYNDKFGNSEKVHRAIINCDNHTTILELARILHNKDIPFIAIHEIFTPQFITESNVEFSSNLSRHVPKEPESKDYKIWIHQYKLLEGIDIPTLQMLFIYQDLRNTRSLIQQIGRIVRNINREDTPSYVYNYTENDYKEEWERYLEIDRSEEIIKGFSQSIFDSFESILPESTYINGKLRKKFNVRELDYVDSEEILDEIRLPLKVNLIETLDGFNFETFIEDEVEKHFREKDKIRFVNPAGANSMFYYYFTVKNSDFLSKQYFPEIRHDVCYVKYYNGILAFYDSSDYLPIGKSESRVGMSISPSKLKKLFKEENECYITRVSLKNSSFGSREIRSHSFMAPNIEETTPFLNDFSHFTNSVYGYYTDKKTYKNSKNQNPHDKTLIKTYLGFSNGRISQTEYQNLSFREYINWINYVLININSQSTPIGTFKRYTSELSRSSNFEPKNILLDLIEIENEYSLKFDGNYVESRELINDRCIDINKNENKSFFNLDVNGTTYEISIIYDLARKKYILENSDLYTKLICHSKANLYSEISLIQILNERQAFRVLTSDNKMYSAGSFYNPSLKYGDQYDSKTSQIERILFPINELLQIGSEKGTASRQNNEKWDVNTLFNLIDELGNGSQLESHFFENNKDDIEFLICDDMGTETADFWLVKSNKIVQIHLKGIGNDSNARPKVFGATGISEVCNQAIKNIHYLSMFDESKPGLNKWRNQWSINEKNDFIVNSRIRYSRDGISEPEVIWNRISELKSNPLVDKEVWLVLGKLFSKEGFVTQIKKSNPQAAALQSYLTLQGTLANIASVGAKLKVFCYK
ncbi:MAG: DEAD/DEAH box helicase family protein [Bacteroidales bacterium]|jgi:superfamily II DNA or RNA helicase|nr:DEAD/DEAH box helicase family protein [Bacteroidales bacterium]